MNVIANIQLACKTLFRYRFEHFDEQFFHVDVSAAIHIDPKFPHNPFGLTNQWQCQQ